METIKCILVGDKNVGKTTLIISYTESGDMLPQYTPKIYGAWSETVTIHGERYSFSIWDTAGGDKYNRIRPLSYPMTDIFIILFDVTSFESFQNVEAKWVPEIAYHCPGVPYIVVGTKLDLREGALDKDHRPGGSVITRGDGELLAERVGAIAYMECSSMTREGVHNMFRTVLEYTAEHFHAAEEASRKKRRCCIV